MSKTILLVERHLPPRLFVLHGQELLSYPIAGRMRLGRATASNTPDIPLKESYISRQHGAFDLLGDGCSYEDLGSSNGTLLNGHRLEPQQRVPLKNGDVLRLQSGDGRDFVILLYATDYPASFTASRIPLTKDTAEINIGRVGAHAMNDAAVSANHASFFAADNGWVIVDHDSTNGVFLNNRRLRAPRYLKNGDCVRIATSYFVFVEDALLVLQSVTSEVVGKATPMPAAPESLLLGEKVAFAKQMTDEGSSVDVPIPSSDSFPPGGSLGTGGRLRSDAQCAPLPPKSPTMSAPAPLAPAPSFTGGAEPRSYEPVPFAGSVPQITPAPPFTPMPPVDDNALRICIVERSVWQRAKKLMLLQNINMTIRNGEMVLILGGSGAGKTTFMNAVMGYEKAEGKIMHGSTDVYEDFESMKFKIGFVPQQDLLRGSDSVYYTLENAADMKLPPRIGKAAKQQRIARVLETLGLAREANSLVSKLSGGQRKRLSIAVEYIADPSLFFLDEPDSGLDGVMSKALMQNLRAIADEGKIVMVISHAPDRAADLFNKVIVLAKSSRDNCGHLAFFGTVEEAYRFFDTDSLEGVVRRINRPDEGGDGRADEFIERYSRNMR